MVKTTQKSKIENFEKIACFLPKIRQHLSLSALSIRGLEAAAASQDFRPPARFLPPDLASGQLTPGVAS